MANYQQFNDQGQAPYAQNPYAPQQQQQPQYGAQPGYAPPNPYAQPPQQQHAQNPYAQPPPPYVQQQQYQPPQQQVVYGQPPQYYAQQQPGAQHPPQQQRHHAAQGSYQPPGGKQVAHAADPYVPHAGAGGEPAARFADAPSGCRDMPWAILFVLHLIGICVLAGVFYRMYHSELSNNNSHDSSSRRNELKIDRRSLGIVGAVVGIGMLMAALWLELFKRFAKTLIWICLLLSPCLMIALGIVFLGPLHVPIAAVFCFLLAFVNLLFVYFVRHRIQFSANILSIVVQVLQQYRATTLVAYGAVVLQVVWMCIWIVAAAGTMHSFRNQERRVCDAYGCHTEGSSDGSVGMAWFFLLLSFYWTLQVIKNVTHVTTAGVVASWYFFAPQMPSSPTWGALKRASWSSLGSICLGSLLIAVIKAMRTMVNSARNAEHPIAQCIVLCILDMLERAVRYFNIYAFTQVAIFGKPYCEAARDTWELLKSSGVSALINDDIIGPVLFFASLMTGLVGAGAAGILAKTVWPQPLWGLWALIGGLVAMAICFVALEVVASAVVALFVCWSEDPEALNRTKPHLYAAMQGAIGEHRINQAANQPQQRRRG